MIPACRSLVTSFFTTSEMTGLSRLCGCLTGFAPSSNNILCMHVDGLIPGMSTNVHPIAFLWREWREWSGGLPFHADLICVVISPLPLIITKLPLCHSDLQKCHSGLQMLTHWLCWRGNDMEMMWQWCEKSLQLNINVQAPKFASPKYLKIIKNKN